MNKVRSLVCILFCTGAAGVVGLAPVGAAAQALPWMNTSLSPVQRAELLVGAMTLDQKIQQLHGQGGAIAELPECGNPMRHVPGIASLQIPTFRITNGPVGLGGGDCNPQDRATALPVALGLAASFDPALAYTFGDLMAREARQLGLHELEGPGINMARVGRGGRNFEYLGEDPFLAGTMAANEIRGIQINGIIGMVKHYVLNDQEQNRMSVSVDVDNRVLYQLYLLPYEMSVKDGAVGSIMCSYNRIGGVYACENPYMLTEVLRKQWGFDGYVQSDFGATHSTAPSLNAGEDFEMQNGTWYSATRISAALADSSLSMATIDRALKRRYQQMFRFGIFDRPITHTPIDANTAAAHGAVARSIGEQAAVLLKNNANMLPLDVSRIRTIALVGQATFANAAVAGGGGSSRVLPTYTVTPLQGLQNVLTALGSAVTVTQVVVANNNSNLADAVTAATTADITIMMAGVVTNEGGDRPSLSLPNDQDALISAVAAAAPGKTVLVLKDGDPILMPWIDQVPAILEAWNPGQEDGNIIARLLFGLANPSGKLPVTYPKLATDTPTNTPDRYPGVTEPGAAFPMVRYSEGLQMGYRWYNARNVEPLFPFGYGLSYTSFKISKLEVTPKKSDGTRPIRVQFFVENTGKRAGAEVLQVYFGFPTAAGEPPKRLVAFEKVRLQPGEKKKVQIAINPAANSHPIGIWDSGSQQWKVVEGNYLVMVGNSSANIVLSDSVTVRTPPGRK
jgi:beta-glucosidase